MTGNCHAPFLGGLGMETSPGYPTRDIMCRQDICVTKEDFLEFVRLARLRHPALAAILKNSKEIINDTSTGKSKYKIRFKNIDKEDALDFLHRLIEDEICSTTSDEVRQCGHLVEVWRPIAEGPL